MTEKGQGNIPQEVLDHMTENFGILHLLGMQILSSEDGVGKVGIQIDKRLMHPQQIVHGGVIFTLADSAMSMALMSVIPPGTPFGTIEAKINYLLPVRAGALLAEGMVVHKGRSTAVLEATVYNTVDGERTVVAKVLGTFNIARPRQSERIE